MPVQMANAGRGIQMLFCKSAETQREQVEECAKNADREQEDKLKKGQENSEKDQRTLYEVKTNKEYQAMLKEIEALRTEKQRDGR